MLKNNSFMIDYNDVAKCKACGSAPIMVYDDKTASRKKQRLECFDCELKTPRFETIKEAFDYWNKVNA